MIKLGIIGLGHMGGYHFSAAQLIPGVQVVAIADPNENNWSKVKDNKIVKTKNYQDLLDLVDSVIIAVPTEFHHEVAKCALLKNKHVLVEKPITKNLDQAKELFDIALKNNLALHIGHVERFNGAVQELHKIIDKPYLIEAHRIGPFAPRVQQDSVIIDLMIHDIDLILNLINSPVKNASITGNKFYSNLADIATATISFTNGTLATITSSRASQTKQRTMSIHQDNSFIKLDFTTQDISIHKNTSDSAKFGVNQLKYRQESTIERLFVYKDNPLKLEIENFINSIKTGQNLLDTQKDLSALNLTLKLDQLLKDQLHDCNYSGYWQSSSTSL